MDKASETEPRTPKRFGRNSYFIGGAALAAGLAAVLFLKLDAPRPGTPAESPAPIAESLAQYQAHPEPVPDLPPPDETLAPPPAKIAGLGNMKKKDRANEQAGAAGADMEGESMGTHSHWKSFEAVLTVAKNGSVTKVMTIPRSPETAKCLQLKLADKPAAFRSKASGKITLQIKNF